MSSNTPTIFIQFNTHSSQQWCAKCGWWTKVEQHLPQLWTHCKYKLLASLRPNETQILGWNWAVCLLIFQYFLLFYHLLLRKVTLLNIPFFLLSTSHLAMVYLLWLLHIFSFPLLKKVRILLLQANPNTHCPIFSFLIPYSTQ